MGAPQQVTSRVCSHFPLLPFQPSLAQPPNRAGQGWNTDWGLLFKGISFLQAKSSLFTNPSMQTFQKCTVRKAQKRKQAAALKRGEPFGLLFSVVSTSSQRNRLNRGREKLCDCSMEVLHVSSLKQ